MPAGSWALLAGPAANEWPGSLKHRGLGAVPKRLYMVEASLLWGRKHSPYRSLLLAAIFCFCSQTPKCVAG